MANVFVQLKIKKGKTAYFVLQLAYGSHHFTTLEFK